MTSAQSPPLVGQPRPAGSLPEHVSRVLCQYGISQTRVLVGVSGGADSVALLHLLLEIAASLKLELVVAHLDHGLRAESSDDARWVEALCRQRGVACISRRLDEQSSALLQSEDDARQARRTFLQDIAATEEISWIALAHTANDQAETVLMRLLRGTGPRGLAGMQAVSALQSSDSSLPPRHLVRPLLDINRSELEEWLQQHQQSWRTDSTNSDPRFTRNRVRHELLPLLRSVANPRIDAALIRLADQCRALTDWSRHEAGKLLEQALLEQHPDRVKLSLAALSCSPQPLVSELFVLLWEQQGWPMQRMAFEHWQKLAGVATSNEPEQRLQVPGAVDVKRRGTILDLVALP